ncbi:MAG: Threonylcarbamoyladenosine tRNA methylthiotransferase MtaB [bacterium]|nr:Threonylcarbamoyladenosine tRNA methylthiotransferase MtaB [bacterium]
MIGNTFRQSGYELVEFGQAADVCVINSCTVTEQADSKCRQLVRQVLRKNPATFVAVVGCYAQIGSAALQKIAGIDLIVGTQDKLRVIEYIDDPIKLPEPRVIKTSMTKAPFTIAAGAGAAPTTRANLKIQDGCDFMCSFCVIPFARGRARSRALGDIQREALQLIDAGHQELVLTGVNIGTYQFEDKKFFDVVKMLLAIPELKRLRISSIEPTTIPNELIALMADSEVLCPHLHIPVQSGDDHILAGMKRLYTTAEYLQFIEYAAARVPDVLIGTDLMSGFPGESEAAFRASCDLLKNSPLAYAHVFTFSERGGTAATRLKNKVAPPIKKIRSAELHRLSEAKKFDFYKRFLGRQLRVLTEEQSTPGHWLGFSDNYIKVAIPCEKLSPNSLVRVRLASVAGDTGIGEIVKAASVE